MKKFLCACGICYYLTKMLGWGAALTVIFFPLGICVHMFDPRL